MKVSVQSQPLSPANERHAAGEGSLRVLFDSDVFSYQTEGGISRYFAELLRRLPDHGVKVRTAAPVSFNRHLRAVGRDVFAGVRAPSYLRNPLTRRLASVLSRMSDELAVRTATFDLLHQTYYRRRYPGRLCTATTVVDMIPELFPELFPSWNPHRNKLRQVRESALVLAISETTRADLVQFAPDLESRIVVTPLAVDVEAFAPRRGVAAQEGEYVLFVGGRSGHKNFALFSQALSTVISRYPTLQVLCVGGGPFSRPERKALAAMDLTAKFRQVAVSDEDLPALYWCAKALVVPSLYEGFGLPVLEAFASGCPVTASKAGALPEIAGAAAAYFDPRDPESIANSVGEVVSNTNLRNALRAAGMNELRRYSWDRTAAATACAYRGLFEARG